MDYDTLSENGRKKGRVELNILRSAYIFINLVEENKLTNKIN